MTKKSQTAGAASVESKTGDITPLQAPAPLGFVFGQDPERDIRRLFAARETLPRWDEKSIDKAEERAFLVRQISVLSALYSQIAAAIDAGKSLLEILRAAFPDKYPPESAEPAAEQGES